jgi:hypothetical protein
VPQQLSQYFLKKISVNYGFFENRTRYGKKYADNLFGKIFINTVMTLITFLRGPGHVASLNIKTLNLSSLEYIGHCIGNQILTGAGATYKNLADPAT